MPIDARLLDILCCPETRTRVVPLGGRDLERLNAAVRAGRLRYADNSAVDAPLTEGLITEDGRRVFRIDDDIPVMLLDRSISTDQLESGG